MHCSTVIHMKVPKSISPYKHPLSMILENPAHLSPKGYEKLLNTFLYGRSEKTRRAYKRDLWDFTEFCEEKDLITTIRLLIGTGQAGANLMALDFKEHLIRSGKAPASINRKLASLRSLTRMARVIGLISWTLEVSNVANESYRDTSGPGLNAISVALNHLSNKSKPKALRDIAIFRMLYDLGLRRAEISKLDFEDLDMANKKIQVLGKGKRTKVVMSLSSSSTEALQRWIEIRGTESGPLFYNFDRAKKGLRLSDTSIYRIVRKIGNEIGVKMRPHGIRHTAITEACKIAVKEQIPLEEIIQFSRHKDIRTLLIYRDREENLQGRISNLIAQVADKHVIEPKKT